MDLRSKDTSIAGRISSMSENAGDRDDAGSWGVAGHSVEVANEEQIHCLFRCDLIQA